MQLRSRRCTNTGRLLVAVDCQQPHMAELVSSGSQLLLGPGQRGPQPAAFIPRSGPPEVHDNVETLSSGPTSSNDGIFCICTAEAHQRPNELRCFEAGLPQRWAQPAKRGVLGGLRLQHLQSLADSFHVRDQPLQADKWEAWRPVHLRSRCRQPPIFPCVRG